MDIIIGKYVATNSLIHKIDPRLKILFNITYVVLFFVVSHFVTLIILFSVLALAFILATKSPLKLIKMLKMPLVVGIVIFLVNSFVLKEENIKNSLSALPEYLQPQIKDLVASVYYVSPNNSIFVVSYIGIMRAVTISFRIYNMIIVTTILTFTTKPILLTKAIEDLLYPFKLIKLPVNIFAMIISIALRFVPTILSEANRIMKAQASRGVDFKNGKGSEKIKAMVTLTIPLFVIAFQRAEDLGNAMETRGFEPYAKRTRYRVLKLKWFDYLFFLFLAGIIIGISFLETNFDNIAANLPLWYQYTYIKF
ncbi:energy-coupling factor transporter transmembrane component T family protein [Candidatus Mycoplasma pogonae]